MCQASNMPTRLTYRDTHQIELELGMLVFDEGGKTEPGEKLRSRDEN